MAITNNVTITNKSLAAGQPCTVVFGDHTFLCVVKQAEMTSHQESTPVFNEGSYMPMYVAGPFRRTMRIEYEVIADAPLTAAQNAAIVTAIDAAAPGLGVRLIELED